MAGTTISVKRQWGISSTLNAIKAFYVTIKNLVLDVETLRVSSAENSGDVNTVNDMVSHRWNRDGVIGGSGQVGTGIADTTKFSVQGVCRYTISGVEYTVQNAEIEPVATEVTQAKYGAWRITADKLGAILTQAATANGTTGTQAHDTAQEALMSLAQIARAADSVDIGYVVILAASGGFTPQVDLPIIGDAQVDGITWYDARAPRLDNGFTAAPSVGLSEGTSDDEYAHGTINVRTNGLNYAEIVADVTKAWTENDIITSDDKFGGHLLITDIAGTAVLSLSQTGIAGSAQTVDSATSAAVQTALDLLYLSLPTIFTIIGQEITQALKASFTYNTDDLAGTDGQAVWTDAVVTAFDRTNVSGVGVGPTPPTVPAANGNSVAAASALVASDITTIEQGD